MLGFCGATAPSQEGGRPAFEPRQGGSNDVATGSSNRGRSRHCDELRTCGGRPGLGRSASESHSQWPDLDLNRPGILGGSILGSEDGTMETPEQSKGSSNRRYTPSEKEQAVRLVRQLRKELGTDQGVVARVARQLGYGVETVRAGQRSRRVLRGNLLRNLLLVNEAQGAQTASWLRRQKGPPRYNVISESHFSPPGCTRSVRSALLRHSAQSMKPQGSVGSGYGRGPQCMDVACGVEAHSWP